MSSKCIRVAVSTNIYSDGGCKKLELLDRDDSDGIAISTWNGISDRSGGIEHMSVKCIREAVGTNIQVDSCGQQWKFSNRDGSDGIAPSTRNGIGDRTGRVEHMS